MPARHAPGMVQVGCFLHLGALCAEAAVCAGILEGRAALAGHGQQPQVPPFSGPSAHGVTIPVCLSLTLMLIPGCGLMVHAVACSASYMFLLQSPTFSPFELELETIGLIQSPIQYLGLLMEAVRGCAASTTCFSST